MPITDDKIIKRVLEYNPNRPYIGAMTASALHDAYAQARVSQTWDTPRSYVDVKIGTINGDVICRALWNEMSYNPVRFGSVSPFEFGGRNSIYRFCRTRPDETADNFEKLMEVRHHLIEFMTLNADVRGAWNDVIYAPGGTIPVGITEEGYSDRAYKMLAELRAGVKAIARQNVADFKRKRGPYRSEIIRVVNLRHPDGVRPIMPMTPPKKAPPRNPPQAMQMTYDPEDHLDKIQESLEITLANAAYVSPDVYEQAMRDYESLMNTRRNEYQK